MSAVNIYCIAKCNLNSKTGYYIVVIDNEGVVNKLTSHIYNTTLNQCVLHGLIAGVKFANTSGGITIHTRQSFGMTNFLKGRGDNKGLVGELNFELLKKSCKYKFVVNKKLSSQFVQFDHIESNNIVEYEWKNYSSIFDAVGCMSSGVYIIIHKGKQSRVVYVGVSNNIGRRMQQHIDAYLEGNHNIYNAGKDDDVYDWMSMFSSNNPWKEYKENAEKRLVWASTTLKRKSPTNLLATSQKFDSKWRDICNNKYLPCLGVSVIPMHFFQYKQAIEIESSIQKRLVSTFELNGIFNVEYISVLGKIEVPSVYFSEAKFSNSPPVDEVTKLVLKDLNSEFNSSHIAFKAREQLSGVINARVKEKQLAQRALRSEIYKSKNKDIDQPQDKDIDKPKDNKWTDCELEKLRVMLVDYNMTPLDISAYLDREPNSIAERIEYNDKISNRRWRSNSMWL